VPLEEIEKAAILSTLQAAGGNKSEAARRLGITRKTLHKKLKAYGEMP
jgi:two-component system response regulator HydG